MTDVEQVMKKIDTLGDPIRMTLHEWKDFLETIIAECESRVEGVNVDLKNDESQEN